MEFQSSYNRYKILVDQSLKELSYAENSGMEIYAPLDYMLAIGGKRIRPVIALAACEAFGGDINTALKPAMGMEVFHNFTLIHDDIMDNASLRRGMSTVHEKWDENTGILSGDLMMIKAYELICESPEKSLREVMNIFNRVSAEVCEGQAMDMAFEKRNDVSIEEYLQMIEGKTAVLLGGSLYIGSIIGGANSEDATKLYDFGCLIGKAFQIKDDWLDTFGDEKLVGKKIGGDILAGKKTYLMIKALELASPEQKKFLHDYVSSGMSEGEKIKEVVAVYNALNISSTTISDVNEYVGKAIGLIQETSMKQEGKDFFIEMTEFLINRDF
jgi:geranylgeranyl diphosphate synthase type II